MSLTYEDDGRKEGGKKYVCKGIWRRCERGASSEEGGTSAWVRQDPLYTVDNLEQLLEAFFSLVPPEEDKMSWEKFGRDLSNLALRILKALEHTDNFQSHLSKLLPSIRKICSQSSEIWRQVLRPLLNIFANKKMEFDHLKGAVKELKTILKYVERSEMAMFTRENLHLLRSFYKLTFLAGDFLLQMNVLEIVFVCAAGDARLAEALLSPANPTTRQLLQTLNFLDFEKDSRIFLNSFNTSLGARKRVFSINCNLVYFGNLLLSAPRRMDGIWVDINRDSRRITIFCSDFLSNSDGDQCVMLQLPLSAIEKLKIEFDVLSGDDCYCITIETSSLTDMYEFAKGRTMVCAVPSRKNPRDAVTDFVRVAEELSAEIRGRREEGKKFPAVQPTFFQPKKTGYCDIDKCQAEKRKPSCTSPVVFTIGSIHENEGKRLSERNRMSRTSPLMLPQELKERMRSQPRNTGRDEANLKSNFFLKNINFQVHQFSDSPIENPSSSQSNNTNDHSGSKRNSELIPKFERLRLPQAMSCQREEGRQEKREMEESTKENRRRRRLMTFGRICEDFIVTEEFEAESSNVESNAPKRDVENRGPKSGTRKKAKKETGGCLSAKRKGSEMEERWKTSLLDPNGYAFKRWQRPTSSERSNFWLNKLRDPHITVSMSETDVFEFTEELPSDDSNLFLDDVVAKKGEPCPASKREWRRAKGRKTHAKPAEKRRPTETDSNAAPETGAHSKARWRESKAGNLEINTGIRMGEYKRADPFDDLLREPDTSTSSSKKEQRSSGGKRTPIFTTKRKICSIRKKGRKPALPQNKHVPKTRCLKELEDIATSLRSGFDKLLEEIGEEEGRRVREYVEEIQGGMLALTKDEDEEMVNRSKRFELCIQYFLRGCSALDSNQDLQVEIEKRVESMANLIGRERDVEEKVRTFGGKLKESIVGKAEATLNKQINIARIRKLQFLLSSNPSKASHSHSQHFQ